MAIVATATSEPPHPEATWSHRAIAQRVAGTCFASVSASQVGRILADLDLKPHKVRGWLTRRDTPDFWQRAADVCALYLEPPERAVVLSIDEKTAIAARSRRYPGRPARPGEPVRQEFEYRRHGTASLVAALDVRTGEVLTEVITRNDAVTFTGFLDQLDAVIAPGHEVHIVLDNGSSHTAKHTKAWLALHPRSHVRWTPPHASWLNQVELTQGRDTGAIAEALQHHDGPATVLTESVFSVDGDAMPLTELAHVARRAGAAVVVDDAHGFGVLGPGGRGALAAAGLAGARDVVCTITLSKALGSQGGAVLGPARVIEHLINTARTFMFDTGLNPAATAAALAGLHLLRRESTRASRARDAARELHTRLTGAGLDSPPPDACVVSVRAKDAGTAVRWAPHCRNAGVAVGCFRPPTVPDGIPRLRMSAQADLTPQDIDHAAAVVIRTAPIRAPLPRFTGGQMRRIIRAQRVVEGGWGPVARPSTLTPHATGVAGSVPDSYMGLTKRHPTSDAPSVACRLELVWALTARVRPVLPGQRGKGQVEGSGLDLAIALENARLHRGDLTVTNAPDGGATFSLRLPRWAPDPDGGPE